MNCVNLPEDIMVIVLDFLYEPIVCIKSNPQGFKKISKKDVIIEIIRHYGWAYDVAYNKSYVLKKPLRGVIPPLIIDRFLGIFNDYDRLAILNDINTKYPGVGFNVAFIVAKHTVKEKVYFGSPILDIYMMLLLRIWEIREKLWQIRDLNIRKLCGCDLEFEKTWNAFNMDDATCPRYKKINLQQSFDIIKVIEHRINMIIHGQRENYLTI